ncbi:MAG: NAD-dependent epimerase/dehydratase family protein, partial [Saprospiraceae bacterium]
YLLRYLLKHGRKKVRALRRKTSSMALVQEVKNQVEWVDGDLLDILALEEAMEGVQQVYHTAAVVSFQGADGRRMIKVNQQGTANVVNLALEMGVEKLVHVSSIAAIGRDKGQQHIDETTKWQPAGENSQYGISKHLAEMEVWRGIAEGLPAAIVNPSNVLGSGFWRGRTTTGQLFYKIWKGLKFLPQGATGFVDVRDVALFSVSLMESGITGERYILNGENLPYATVFSEIAKVLNVPPPSIPVNAFLRETVWRAAWLFSKLSGQAPFITKEIVRASARNYYYDAGKSLRAIPGFCYTPISQTIEQTGRQFLESTKKDFQPMVLPV